MSPKDVVENFIKQAKAVGGRLEGLKCDKAFIEELRKELGEDPSEHYGIPFTVDDDADDDAIAATLH